MIHTIVSSGALYLVNRDRGAMMLAREKRRAFWLCCGVTVSVAIALWLVYL